jgi:hypothetical protein
VRSLDFSRYALMVYVTAALLAGCGGSQPPIGAPGAVPQASAIATHADRGKSWMLPEAKRKDLLYLAEFGPNVFVYSYPEGKHVGTLTGFGAAPYECADKSGDVFIASFQGSNEGIYEYAHGGAQPINFLPLSGAFACSVDPTTGNLAVIREDGGGVYVYADAQGTPIVYTDSDFYFTSGVAYDSSGNLFINGEYQPSKGGFALVELPRGSSTFEQINFSGYSGGSSVFEPIFWDGKYLDLGSEQQSKQKRGRRPPVQTVLDQLQISGSSATLIGTVPLALQHRAEYPQFWIQGDTVIQPSNEPHSYVQYFHYPSGKSTKRIDLAGEYDIWGVTVSVASSRSRIHK